MPLLPQPDTTSPGALQILYRTTTIDHVTSANFIAGVDITALSPIRDAAESWRDILADLLLNTATVNGWRIVDPAGVSLYEEDFPAAAPGVRAPATSEILSQSASGTLTGKGVPDVGLAQGQCRVVTFLGSFDPVQWPDARQGLSDGAIDFGPLRDFLLASDIIGADHYGTKATFRNYWTPQINAHYQKAYGL